MREIRSSGSVEGVVSDHDPYSDCARKGIPFPENQIGSRYRRSRTAAARNTAANARPIHKPGLLKNLPGVICVKGMKWGSTGAPLGVRKENAFVSPPITR